MELAPEKQKSLSMQKSSDNICPVNNISCDIVYLHSISILNFCGIHKVNQFICEVVVRIKLNNRLKALIMGQTQLDSNTLLPVRDLLLAWLGSQTHLFHRKKKKKNIDHVLPVFLSWHFLLWPHQPAIVHMILDMISWPFRATWSAGLQQDKKLAVKCKLRHYFLH